MTSRSLIVVGCGGLGREVVGFVATAVAGEWVLIGSVDDDPSPINLERLSRCGGTFLGGLDQLEAHDAAAVVAVGDPLVRRGIVQRMGPGIAWASVIATESSRGPDIVMGEGCLIAPGVRMTCNIRIGRHVQIDQNSTVAHDVELGDFVRVSPQVNVTGSVRVGAGALLGAGAVVLPGVCIGPGAVIGAGAVVVRDVAPGAVVKGVPAR